jgi:DNA modification methylase
MMTLTDIPVHEWQGCYDETWKGLIVDDAFAHPAKFAPGLIRRIIQHGLARGYWQRGDLIADPFGGIAGGGVMAAYFGINWLGVELEPRFVELGNRNLALHAPKWQAFGEVSLVKLVQGDSRKFAEVVAREVRGVVTSPPYANMLEAGGADTPHPDGCVRRGCGIKDRYGKMDGQISKLPEGSVDAAITSPPYAETPLTGERNFKSRFQPDANKAADNSREGYGATEGQIGKLKDGTVAGAITSPPYNLPFSQEHPGRAGGERGITPSEGGAFVQYGVAAGQIEGLPNGTVAGAITSPPFGEQQTGGGIAKANGKNGNVRTGQNCGYRNQAHSVGNIADESPETYWQAMAQVYRQCLIALRPGGYAAIVVKDYVKDKARVPLCDQTLQLLTAVGFQPVERIRAMLVKTTTRDGLFGTETKTTERKSFFRRLAEKKGSPRIDWEEVLVVRKPVELTRSHP